MTSSNGNIFRVTGPLCREFTGHRWIPLTKANDGELWCFLWYTQNRRLSKRVRRWWIPCTLCRPCNEVLDHIYSQLRGISYYALQWRHNERDGISDHQPHDCLLNRLFRHKSKKTSKLRVTGLCAGNSPETVEFPAQRASNGENVSIWWRNHVWINIGSCNSFLPDDNKPLPEPKLVYNQLGPVPFTFRQLEIPMKIITTDHLEITDLISKPRATRGNALKGFKSLLQLCANFSSALIC